MVACSLKQVRMHAAFFVGASLGRPLRFGMPTNARWFFTRVALQNAPVQLSCVPFSILLHVAVRVHYLNRLPNSAADESFL